MRAYVQLRGPDGTIAELSPGDIVGRLQSASLCVNDGRVSEAHAMVSLREEELRLISLRGVFAVGGRPLRELVLEPGQVIELAPGVAVHVLAVALPEAVLGVEGPGLPRQVLPPVCSFLTDPHRIVAGWIDGAPAHAWSTGRGWSLRQGDGPDRSLEPGDSVDVGAVVLDFVRVSLRAASGAATARAGGLDAPLRLIVLFDAVHVHREEVLVCTLSGVLARLVSELVAFDGPAPWKALVGELWPEEPDTNVLRSRLDTNLFRLRARLRDASVRTDLVQTNHAGSVELVLYPRDTVEDRT